MYQSLLKNWAQVRAATPQRPMTLSDKILATHLLTPGNGIPRPLSDSRVLKLVPDRVAMQDASAQTAILQFMLSGRPSTAVPTSIHCDHLIEAFAGADKDVKTSLQNNKEIYHFLQSAAKKYGIDYWAPGAGIIHQIVLENYAAPGTLMLGTDSHTPNAGGLGMVAIGVGGADAVDAMAGIPWELKTPKILGVRLTGKLQGWAAPKDVILKLVGKLTVQGGTNHIIEYFGPGVESLSCTGMATICNMGAEVGATTSIFPYTPSMGKYLEMTHRHEIAKGAEEAFAKGLLTADPKAEYDKVIEINLSELEPHINGPFSPGIVLLVHGPRKVAKHCGETDAATPLSKFKSVVKERGWKEMISAGLIGSCTNSSYQDMSKVVSIVKQAQTKGLKATPDFFISPGSEQIRATIERDGFIQTLTEAGGQVLANACGPCIGQWNRNMEGSPENVILTSFNRNFRGRNDGKPNTMNFLASPEIVTAMTFAGRLTFNPITDSLQAADGSSFKFDPPTSQDLPPEGFTPGRETYRPLVSEPDPSVTIFIDPESDRLQLLAPFEPWSGTEFADLRVLIKVSGKCTTDHISAAGPWLKFKGHLNNIANNTLIGATNAFNGKVNSVLDELTGDENTVPSVARHYKQRGVSWAVIADKNYGEGSAREHAALQPRFLGCKLIVARSFARIHGKFFSRWEATDSHTVSLQTHLETNLKKQGVIPVTFVDPSDYDRIPPQCLISTKGLPSLSPGSPLSLIITPKDGVPFEIPVHHTMSEDQIGYFKAGSALNMIAASVASAGAKS